MKGTSMNARRRWFSRWWPPGPAAVTVAVLALSALALVTGQPLYGLAAVLLALVLLLRALFWQDRSGDRIEEARDRLALPTNADLDGSLTGEDEPTRDEQGRRAR
jgi:hypothetical protein